MPVKALPAILEQHQEDKASRPVGFIFFRLSSVCGGRSMQLEPAWGPIGKEIYERTYSRPKEDGSSETWADTVARVVRGNTGLVDDKFIEIDEREKLFDLIYNFKIMPGGRHLWASGVPGRQFLFNCWRAPFTSKMADHYTFMFDQLMQGGGVGANYSNRYIHKISKLMCPVNVKFACVDTHTDIEEMQYDLDYVYKSATHISRHHMVDDTREGWVEALKEIIDRHFWSQQVSYETSTVLIIDVSKVRGRGELIKGFGGVASGPGPLIKMLAAVNDLMNKSIGQQLSTVQHMQIDHEIAKCVVAGNVRRSARMSIKSWLDSDILEFINCKGSDKSDHWTTNISVEIDNEFISLLNTDGPLANHAKKVYHAVIEGMLRDGEPGFYNISLAQQGENGDVASTNPCVPASELLLEKDGYKTFGELFKDDSKLEIHTDNRIIYNNNGNEKKENWNIIQANGTSVRNASNVFLTKRSADILKIVLKDGHTIRLTPDHHVATTSGMQMPSDLKEGDKVLVSIANPVNYIANKEPTTIEEIEATLMGLIAGDGCFSKGKLTQIAHIDFWGEDRLINSQRVQGYLNKIYNEYSSIYCSGSNRPFSAFYISESKNKVRISSSLLACILKDKYGFTKETKLIVPNKIMSSARKPMALYYIAALFYCDGSVQGTLHSGFSVRLAQSNEDLLKSVQLLLQANGIYGRIFLRRKGQDRMMPDGKGGLKSYFTKANYELIISGSRDIFGAVVGLWSSYKDKKLNTLPKANNYSNIVSSIVSIEKDGIEDVYCLQEPLTRSMIVQGIAVRRCGEIALEPYEACILGHVNLAAFSNNSPDDYTDAFRLMTRFLMRATFGDIPNKQARAIVDKNRRIGVGIYGFQSWLVQHGIRYSESHRSDFVKNNLKFFKSVVNDEKHSYAFKLRIAVPIKGTTMAPTGTIAKLDGSTEGAQTCYSPFVIRNVRYADNDPSLDEFMQAGHKIEDCIYNPNTKVVSFFYKDPVVDLATDPDIVEGAADVHLEDFLAVQAMLQEHYVDNSISFTINVIPDKYSVEECKEIFKKYLPILKGTTVMPDGTRPQSPYIRITKEEYELAEYAKSVGAGELSCSIGGCPVR